MKIPKRLRKAINSSGTKPCDICGKNELLQEHHIEGRNIPNPNHPSNLCSICPNCHFRAHRGLIVIEKWCQTSNGKELLHHSVDEMSFSGRDAKPFLV